MNIETVENICKNGNYKHILLSINEFTDLLCEATTGKFFPIKDREIMKTGKFALLNDGQITIWCKYNVEPGFIRVWELNNEPQDALQNGWSHEIKLEDVENNSNVESTKE